MKKIDIQGRNRATSALICLRTYRIEDYSNFIYSIRNNPKKIMEDLVYNDAIIDRPDIIDKIESSSDDYENIIVDEFISYHYAKGNNPANELYKIYKLLTETGIPSPEPTTSITGNFDQITLKQEPGYPVVRLYFTEKQKKDIKS